jgi:ligand-binding SRPBCC domain-containing protein
MQNTTDPMAFVTQLTPETQAIMHEYLQLPFCIGELLANKPQAIRERVLTELAQYVDIRGEGPYAEIYFKHRQQQEKGQVA